MKHCPSTWGLADLFTTCRTTNASLDGVNWFPARPQTTFGVRARLRATWLVFTGRADAVVWPGGQ